MVWELSRPEPALPSSCLWTWDHSTNWVLDDPRLINFGFQNRYLKRPESFTQDYRQLTDFAAGLGVKGIVIWGFLRDSHGGIESAKRVADHAVSRGVAILPGIGTNWYGGAYYEGDHPYNLETFIQKNPGARLIDERGQAMDHGVCPTSPRFSEWVRDGVEWMFREFAVGGANLENGDVIVCYDQGCAAHRESWPHEGPEFLRIQALCYPPALEGIERELDDKLVTCGSYTGFLPGQSSDQFASGPQLDQVMIGPHMQSRRSLLAKLLPARAVCQWTLTGMMLQAPLPLTTYLETGSPDAVFDNPAWPRDLAPPTVRSVGLLHQGSQWYPEGRYRQFVSTIKEACLRAYRAGMEGISIHGEVSSLHTPAALNYLAFSHFVHWPEDSLVDLGRKTIGQVLGSQDDGESFVRILAHWDADTLTESQIREAEQRAHGLRGRVAVQRTARN